MSDNELMGMELADSLMEWIEIATGIATTALLKYYKKHPECYELYDIICKNITYGCNYLYFIDNCYDALLSNGMIDIIENIVKEYLDKGIHHTELGKISQLAISNNNYSIIDNIIFFDCTNNYPTKICEMIDNSAETNIPILDHILEKCTQVGILPKIIPYLHDRRYWTARYIVMHTPIIHMDISKDVILLIFTSLHTIFNELSYDEKCMLITIAQKVIDNDAYCCSIDITAEVFLFLEENGVHFDKKKLLSSVEYHWSRSLLEHLIQDPEEINDCIVTIIHNTDISQRAYILNLLHTHHIDLKILPEGESELITHLECLGLDIDAYYYSL